MWLPDGQRSFKIGLTIQMQYRRVTDGRTHCCSKDCAMLCIVQVIIIIVSCARGDTICPADLLPRRAPPSRRNVAVVSHAEYVPVTCWPLQTPYTLRPCWVNDPVTLNFDLLTLKVVSESCVMWATSVPILVFLSLSVLNLSLKYVTDRHQTKASLNAPAY